VTFVNETGFIGVLLQSGSSDVTGSLFATLFLLFVLLFFLGMACRIAIEYLVVAFTPFLLVLMAYYTSWYAVGGVFIIALAVIFARNFFVQPR
jgi:hypothetical protein